MPRFFDFYINTATIFAKSFGILELLKVLNRNGVTILMYHKVLPQKYLKKYPLTNLVIDLDAFEKQMDWLKENYQILTVRDALICLTNNSRGKSVRQKPIACVTFDDGYLDNYLHAYPVLQKHGLKATFFISTGFIQGDDLWFDVASSCWTDKQKSIQPVIQEEMGQAAYEEKSISSLDSWLTFLKSISSLRRNKILEQLKGDIRLDEMVFHPMSEAQLVELATSGHEIAAHSVNHPILTAEKDQTLLDELRDAKMYLSEVTGKEVHGLCYPNGNFDGRVKKSAKQCGYSYACTVNRGLVTPRSDFMELSRRAISPAQNRRTTKHEFEAEITGWNDHLRRIKNSFH